MHNDFVYIDCTFQFTVCVHFCCKNSFGERTYVFRLNTYSYLTQYAVSQQVCELCVCMSERPLLPGEFDEPDFKIEVGYISDHDSAGRANEVLSDRTRFPWWERELEPFDGGQNGAT